MQPINFIVLLLVYLSSCVTPQEDPLAEADFQVVEDQHLTTTKKEPAKTIEEWEARQEIMTTGAAYGNEEPPAVTSDRYSFWSYDAKAWLDRGTHKEPVLDNTTGII